MAEVQGLYDTILRRLPPLVNGKIPVVSEGGSSGGSGNSVTGIQLAQITTNGVTPVQLSDIACKEVTLDNLSGSDLLVGYGASPSVYLSLPDGTSRTLPCVSNANEWSIRLATTGSNVTITYMAVQR